MSGRGPETTQTAKLVTRGTSKYAVFETIATGHHWIAWKDLKVRVTSENHATFTATIAQTPAQGSRSHELDSVTVELLDKDGIHVAFICRGLEHGFEECGHQKEKENNTLPPEGITIPDLFQKADAARIHLVPGLCVNC
ncbi:hypothetical protein AN476_18375 [Phaeobacter sp. 11ANDIMAR09]|nr:hypothetical protein AN476_18375 [Phaeobacter sp. 11ANDIMAR09]